MSGEESSETSEGCSPRVGIVVVNYFQEQRTVALLHHLSRTEWPATAMTVVVVDNGSNTGFEEAARDALTGVRLVQSGWNRGFGGACNLGIEALQDCQHIALLNNDTMPDPGWLAPLVEALQLDPCAGAATPKVLFAGQFVEVILRSDAFPRSTTDPRALGVRLLGARVDGLDVLKDIALVSGFWGWERGRDEGSFAWTSGPARFHIPIQTSQDSPGIELLLASPGRPVAVSIEIDGSVETVTVDGSPVWMTAIIARKVQDVINNVGTMVLPTGEAADRGDREVDRGQYDEPEEVEGWSAASVLIRRSYLDDVGRFDERLFLYYEDTDLAWRGRLLGWTYRYVPSAVVRHEHSATVGARNPMVRHLSERNRLLVLTKCAPLPLLRVALWNLLRRLGSAVMRDLVARPLHREPAVNEHALALSRVLLAYVVRFPAFARDRRQLQAETARRARAS